MSTFILFIALAVTLSFPSILVYLILTDSVRQKARFLEFRKDIPRFTFRLLALGSFLWLLSVWTAVSSTQWIDPHLLPTPQAVAEAFVGLFSGGQVLFDIGISVTRILVGFFPAALTGTFIGLLAGNFRSLYAVIIPPNTFVRYIPPTAFIALLIVWFGLGEPLKVSLIALGIFFFLVQMTMDAVRAVPLEYLEVAYTLGTRRGGVFWRVTLPAALPDIMVIWRINISAAWTFLVVAEFLGATQGLGRLLNESFRYNRIPQLYATILLIGFIGLIFDLFFEWILMKARLSWRKYYVES